MGHNEGCWLCPQRMHSMYCSMPKDEAMLNSEKLKSYYLFEGIGQSVSQLLIYFGIRKYCYKNSVVI